MIWLNLAKNYLAAYAAQDMVAIENMLSEDVGYNSVKGKRATLAEIYSTYNDLYDDEDIEIHISNTAYKDKYIVIEGSILIARHASSMICSFEVDYSGKIKSIRTYYHYQ